MENPNNACDKKEDVNDQIESRIIAYFDDIMVNEFKEILDPSYLIKRSRTECVLKERINEIFCNKLLIESINDGVKKTMNSDVVCDGIDKTINHSEPETAKQSSCDLICDNHTCAENENAECFFVRTRKQTIIFANEIINCNERVVIILLILIVVPIAIVMLILILQALIPIFYYLAIVLLISQAIEIATAINAMTGIPTSILMEPLNIFFAYIGFVFIFTTFTKINTLNELKKHKFNIELKIEIIKKLFIQELNELLQSKIDDVDCNN